MDETNSYKEKREQSKKEVVSLLKELVGFVPDRTEDEMYATFQQKTCPFNECDGSGYFIVTQTDGTQASKWCRCYRNEVLIRQLNAAGIEKNYHRANYQLTDLTGTLLHPKKVVEERKFRGKKPAQPKPELPEEYIERVYDRIPIKKGITYFAEEYRDKSLVFLDESPRSRVKNLFFMGEPGRGKTHLACAIGKDYLKKGKKVHFTTMMKLVNDVMNKEINIRKIVSEVDLLIVDEVGYEYQTDTLWAIKQIKELFRIRYNSHLPIICTTNFYPNELAELYDASLMSIFNGTFFLILMESEADHRIQEADEALKDFTFHEE